MIKLKDLITEKKTGYDYGCVMLYFTPNEDVVKFQNQISPSDLYIAEDNGGYGIEDETHCTLLYGLHEEVKLETITSILNKIQFGECMVHTPSLFENEKFDVLKFDVGYPTKGGAFLHKANTELVKLPNTQTYPDYHPHMTVAYLKPGMGKKYVDILNGKVNTFILNPTHAVYSQPNGNKIEIKINKG
jgi:hypothetical protein